MKTAAKIFRLGLISAKPNFFGWLQLRTNCGWLACINLRLTSLPSVTQRLLWRYEAILAGFLTSQVTDIGVAENQIWVVWDMTTNHRVTAETTRLSITTNLPNKDN